MSNAIDASNARTRMTAAGFAPEQVANDTMVMLVARLLQDAAPRPPGWFEGTGKTYAAEIGDYGAVDAQMATVVWDDRKFAECYSDADARWLADTLKTLYARR